MRWHGRERNKPSKRAPPTYSPFMIKLLLLLLKIVSYIYIYPVYSKIYEVQTLSYLCFCFFLLTSFLWPFSTQTYTYKFSVVALLAPAISFFLPFWSLLTSLLRSLLGCASLEELLHWFPPAPHQIPSFFFFFFLRMIILYYLLLSLVLFGIHLFASLPTP